MPFAQTAADENDARFSPDGKWIAYTSDESGMTEVYVQLYPPTGAKLQVSTDPAPFPRARWSSDGKELFYISADYKLVSVGLTYPGGFVEAAPPKALFRVGWMSDYAVSGDGRRMLILHMTRDPFVGPIDILPNWTAALTK